MRLTLLSFIFCTAAHRLWMTLLGVLQNARSCPQPCTGNLVRGVVTAGSVTRPSKRTAAVSRRQLREEKRRQHQRGTGPAQGPLMPGDHLGRSECRHGDQVVDARQVHRSLPGPPASAHLAAWRLPSRTPGASLSDWRAAKAVAARVPGPASCARNARLAVRGPGLRERPPMSAVNTVILRYGRAVIRCQTTEARPVSAGLPTAP